MRLTWKLALSLAFCWILFGSIVLIKVAQIRDEHRPQKNISHSEVNLTAKLILERARAFRSQLMHFIAVRGNSSQNISEAMGVFDAVAFVQLRSVGSTPVRWLEKKIKNPRLHLPESFLARHIFELPFGSMPAGMQFQFSPFAETQGGRGIALIIPMGNSDYVVGYLAESFLTSQLADITANSELTWLSIGSTILSLIEVNHGRISQIHQSLGDNPSTSAQLIEGKSRLLQQQLVAGTNLQVNRVIDDPTAIQNEITLWPTVLFLFALGLVAVVLSLVILQRFLLDTDSVAGAVKNESATVEVQRSEVESRSMDLRLWALLQSLRGPLMVALGHLELLKIEKNQNSHTTNIDNEVRRIQNLVFDHYLAFGGRLEQASEVSLTHILNEFALENQLTLRESMPHVPKIPLEAKSFKLFLQQLFEQTRFALNDVQLEMNDEGVIALAIPGLYTLEPQWINGAKQFIVLNGGEWQFDERQGQLTLRFQCVRSILPRFLESKIKTLADTYEDHTIAEPIAEVSPVPNESRDVDFPIRRPRIREVIL